MRDKIMPIAVAASLTFTNSASAQKTTIEAYNRPDSPLNGGNIVVYRTHIAPLIFKASVAIDGGKPALLGNGDYAIFRTMAGKHKLTLSWPFLSGESGKGANIETQDDKTTYVTIATTGSGGLIRNPPTELRVVEEDIALEDMKKSAIIIPTPRDR